MFTHIDTNNRPTMVDITEKKITTRTAGAQSKIHLPEAMRPYFKGDELILKKGPVFQTAIIAGTMAVKKTFELIPFCHQIPIESCKFDVRIDEQLVVTIKCTVKTSFKTGVEMEALHGAMTAALTVYDMCKAISHEIVIGETRLISKSGGKSFVSERPLYGLVLTGGKSVRMKRDKALINYHGKPHAAYIYDILTKYCDKVFISARENQWKTTELEKLPMILDKNESKGPIAGIISAFEHEKDANWLVVACDLIHFNNQTVEHLLANYNPEKVAMAFANSEKGFPEPLCTLYTPKAFEEFKRATSNEIFCPVKVLMNSDVSLITTVSGINLANINSPEEYAGVTNERS